MPVTENDIIMGYKLFLGREPRSQKVIDEKKRHSSLTALAADFMNSPEFLRRLTVLAPKSWINNWCMIETKFGFKIWGNLSDAIIFGSIMINNYEPEVVSFLQNYVYPSDVVIDIGANIGYFSMLASTLVGNSGKVFSFEPRKQLYMYLENSREANKFEQNKVFNLALGSRREKLQLAYDDVSYNFGGAQLVTDNLIPHGKKVENVKVDVLTNIVGDIKSNFIKIDVEGAEYLVLNPVREYLFEHKPIIISEINKPLLKKISKVNPEEFIISLNEIGYKCRLLNNNGEPGEIFIGKGDFIMANVVFMYD